jgi:hypothetical protein
MAAAYKWRDDIGMGENGGWRWNGRRRRRGDIVRIGDGGSAAVPSYQLKAWQRRGMSIWAAKAKTGSKTAERVAAWLAVTSNGKVIATCSGQRQRAESMKTEENSGRRVGE